MTDPDSAMEEVKAAPAPAPEAQFTAATVEKMVTVMYGSDSVDPQAEAFLIEAQSSFAAWTFSWELLHPSKCQSTQFFGANCLHTKVCHSWYELEPERQEQMKALLKEKLSQFSASYPVTSKLYQLAAVVAIRQRAVSEDSPNPVQYIWSLFDIHGGQNPQDSNVYSYILNILAMIPEEVTKMYKNLRISKTNYMKINSELQAVAPQVLGWLKSLLDSGCDDSAWTSVMRCLESWLGLKVEEVEALLPVMDDLFRIMHTNSNRLSTALRIAGRVFALESLLRHPQSVCRLLGLLSNLGSLLESYAQQKRTDVLGCLCELMVDAAERHCCVLVEMMVKGGTQRDQALALLQNIMTAGFPPGSYQVDEMISTTTLQFWITLKEDLTNQEEELRQGMKEIYSRLWQVLLTKIQYPADDSWNLLHKDDRTDFALYRNEVCDCMEVCYEVLGTDMLNYLCQQLHALIEESRQADTVTWQRVEAIFKSLMLCCVIEKHLDPQFLTMVMNLLPAPSCNPLLLSTVSAFIGVHDRWVVHQDGMLQKVFPLVLEGVRHAESASQAIGTLGRLMKEPLPQVSPLLPPVLMFAQEVLEAEEIPESDRYLLAGLVGMVVSPLPIPQMRAHLTPILMPRLHLMHRLLYQQQPPSPAQSPKEVPAKLQYVTQLLSCVLGNIKSLCGATPAEGQQHEGCRMIDELMVDVFPLLKDMVKQWQSVSGITVVACRLLRIFLKILKSQFRCWLGQVVAMLGDVYQDLYHSSVVNLTKQLVLQFDSDASVAPILIPLINLILQKTSHNIQALKTYPSFIQSFNSSMIELMQCQLMKAELGVHIEGVLCIGVTVLKVPLLNVVTSCTSVVKQFLTLSQERQDYYTIVCNNMLFLVTTVMEVIISTPQQEILELMGDILAQCVSHGQLLPCFTSALKQCLAQGLPDCKATDLQKEAFARFIVRYSKRGPIQLHLLSDFACLSQRSDRK